MIINFKKIQLTKQNTLNVVYTNKDGDSITMVGANIVHRDLKEAIKNLVPHLLLLTEQKEASKTLDELREQRDKEDDNVFKRISVNAVVLNSSTISMGGTRILDRGDVISLESPKISLVDDDKYEYLSELSLDIDNLRYEAEQYVTERKWGLKEATIGFDDANNPFKDVDASVDIKAGEVPTVDVGDAKPVGKKGRRKKKAEVA